MDTRQIPGPMTSLSWLLNQNVGLFCLFPNIDAGDSETITGERKHGSYLRKTNATEFNRNTEESFSTTDTDMSMQTRPRVLLIDSIEGVDKSNSYLGSTLFRDSHIIDDFADSSNETFGTFGMPSKIISDSYEKVPTLQPNILLSELEEFLPPVKDVVCDETDINDIISAFDTPVRWNSEPEQTHAVPASDTKTVRVFITSLQLYMNNTDRIPKNSVYIVWGNHRSSKLSRLLDVVAGSRRRNKHWRIIYKSNHGRFNIRTIIVAAGSPLKKYYGRSGNLVFSYVGATNTATHYLTLSDRDRPRMPAISIKEFVALMRCV